MALLTVTASDAALVRRAVAGDAAASEALVVRYQRKAHGVAHALGVETSSVEDVVQEAFLQAFRGLRKLERPTAFGSWFLSIVRNMARQQLRNAPREELSPFLDSVEVSPLENAEANDLSRYLWQKVAKLPEGTREVIFLYYYDGESDRRVAETLNISKAAVKYRRRKGMDLLRQRLWKELEQALRQERPSQRDWTTRARRLTFLALASLPLSSASGKAAAAGAASASASFLGVGITGAFVMSKKTIVTAMAVLLTLSVVAGFLWFELRQPPMEGATGNDCAG